DYVLSLVMVFIMATMLLASMAFGLVITVVHKTMQENLPSEEYYWHWIEIAGSFLFLTVLFAASYRTLSGGRIRWGYVLYGSFIAAILFTLGKVLLGYYILYSNPASVYGAAGSAVVFLIWVYYSSQVMFFGAELIQAWRTQHEWLYGQ